MAGTALHCEFQRIVVILHLVKLLITLLEHIHDFHGLFDGGLVDGHLLETSHQALVAHDVTVVFLVGRRPDEAHLASLEIGLEQVARVHRALPYLPGSHDVVNLVDVEDGALLGGNTFHHGLEAFLKIATVLRAGNERAHVQLIDAGIAQGLGHVAVLDALRQSIDDGCLAHTGLTDVQGVVLVLAAQHLHRAVEFGLTAYEGIMVGQVVVDAQHIVAPSARRSTGILAFIGSKQFFIIIDFAVSVIGMMAHDALRFGINIYQPLQETVLVLVDESIQAVGCKRFLELQHGQEQMGHIDHIGDCHLGIVLHDLHELPVLMRGIHLAVNFVVTKVLLPVDVIPQLFLHFVEGQLEHTGHVSARIIAEVMIFSRSVV